MFGTPIINPPQSAILGMHGIFDRPVAIHGKVGAKPEHQPPPPMYVVDKHIAFIQDVNVVLLKLGALNCSLCTCRLKFVP